MKWKNYKIFVSSTFKDMDIERDVLKNVVEPYVNEILSKSFCSIEFVDLRHTVKTDTKMSKNDREMQIFNTCIDEIDNCEPFFISLLGHRYGWIPGKELMNNVGIELPASFPIVVEDLSVTAYEFVHGVFAHKNRCRIFVREMASYQNLSADETKDYFDTCETARNNILLLRKYVLSNVENVYPYTLDVSKGINGANMDFILALETEILDMVRAGDSLISDEKSEAISTYTQEHELILQYHLRRFRGRERELEDCQRKLDSRGTCLLAANNQGMGRTAFMCKLYDYYRKQEDNICLLYLKNTPSAFTLEDAVRYWNVELNQILHADLHDAILAAGDNISQQNDILKSLSEMVKNNGQKLFVFIDTLTPSWFVNVGDGVLYSGLLENNNDYGLRPIMYLLNPLSSDAKRHILHGLRPQVADIISRKTSSDNVRWLSKACDIMQTMMKYDFMVIRDIQDDNEAAITRYQSEMAEALPQSFDDLIVYWIDRVCCMAGTQLVHDYLFLMAMAQDGWTDRFVCSVLFCDQLELSVIRQMLGRDVVTNGANGRYKLVDVFNIHSWLAVRSLQDNSDLLLRAYQVLHEQQTLLDCKMQFLLSLLTEHFDDCVQMITTDTTEVSIDKDGICDGLIWLSTNYFYDFNRLTNELLSERYLESENYTKCLLKVMKRIGWDLSKDNYVKWLSTFINNLRHLHIERKISLDHHLCICELLACAFDFYSNQSDWQNAIKAVQDGMAVTADYAADNAKYQAYYAYFVYRFLGFINDVDAKAAFIENRFIKLVNRSNIAMNSHVDTTLISVLYLRAAELYTCRDKIEQASIFCRRALLLSMDMVKQKIAGENNTELDLLSIKRNLLSNLDQILMLHTDYGVIESEDMDQLYSDIMHLCGDVLDEADFNDRIFYLYYVVQVRHIFGSPSDEKEKVETLCEMIYKLLHHDGLNTIYFGVCERQVTSLNWRFTAWLFIKTMMLKIWATMDELQFNLPECCRMYLKDEIQCKDMDILSFDTEVSFLLPIIGTKLADETNSQDNISTIAEPLFNLYHAMIGRELKKDTEIDLQRLVSLYNNAKDIYDNITTSVFVERVQYQLELEEIDALFIQWSKKFGDEIDMERRFYDFCDCLGIPGGYFASNDGFWQNGDPELAINTKMTADADNLLYSQSTLEDIIDREDYEELFTELSAEEELGFSEIYYLALAYLRTDQYIKAINTISIFLNSENIPMVIGKTDIVSSEVLYLTACLLGHEFERFEYFMASVDETSVPDEFRVLMDAYATYERNVDNKDDICLSKPYGKKL